MEQLRKITILIYRRLFIQTHQQLWTTYLKSGMGQLIIQSNERFIYPTDIPIWPKEIKTMVQKLINVTKANENETYMNFVINYINELNNQLKQHEAELNERKNNFRYFTLTIEQMIETYIEKHLSSLHMEIQHKIELIYYDYHIEAVKHAYDQHKPNQYQVCL